MARSRIRRTLEARLSFLGHVFGFEPADAYEPLEMPGLDAWLAGHRRHDIERDADLEALHSAV